MKGCFKASLYSTLSSIRLLEKNSRIYENYLRDGEKLLMQGVTSFKFSKTLMSHPDAIQLSNDDLKLEAGGVDVRNSAHRVILSNITFNSSEVSSVYWEYKILELVSSLFELAN